MSRALRIAVCAALRSGHGRRIRANAPSRCSRCSIRNSGRRDRPSTAGPGVFMRKKDKLFFCVVAETPKSADVATRYCKPVR